MSNKEKITSISDAARRHLESIGKTLDASGKLVDTRDARSLAAIATENHCAALREWNARNAEFWKQRNGVPTGPKAA